MQSTSGRKVFENFIPKCNYSPKYESRKVFKKKVLKYPILKKSTKLLTSSFCVVHLLPEASMQLF